MKKFLSLFPSLALLVCAVPSALAADHSPEFTANPSNGDCVRIWHDNQTAEAVRVYLYRTDSGADELVSFFTVEANSQDSKVYSGHDAGSSTYELYIEAYVSGGEVHGPVTLTQYSANPNL